MSLNFNSGFFNTVKYSTALQNDSWLNYAETAADVCRAPSRWVAAELWSGGKTYYVQNVDLDHPEETSYQQREMSASASQGIQKVMRIVLGLIFSIPGQILALPLMGLAYNSEEIRLKHKLSVQELSPAELEKLKELIATRQELARERQGCEPISCILLSICCMLCILVCRK